MTDAIMPRNCCILSFGAMVGAKLGFVLDHRSLEDGQCIAKLEGNKVKSKNSLSKLRRGIDARN
jgi:hypothetical protein